MQQVARKANRNAVHLVLDVVMFLVFLVAMAPRFSGIAVHEWLSSAFGAAIITHLLLHWQWLVAVTQRFFGHVQWSARLNYGLNALLFIDITIATFSGLLISKALLPTFGLAAHGGVWRGLHELSANLALLLVGLHVALHWQWIVAMVRRVLTPRRRRQLTQLGTHSTGALNQAEEVLR